jgi:hypothetical protein
LEITDAALLITNLSVKAWGLELKQKMDVVCLQDLSIHYLQLSAFWDSVFQLFHVCGLSRLRYGSECYYGRYKP